MTDTSAVTVKERDILAELDDLKAFVESKYGKGESSVSVTPLNRFEEHFAAARLSLELLINQPKQEGE
jgi:hypothetical protein